MPPFSRQVVPALRVRQRTNIELTRVVPSTSPPRRAYYYARQSRAAPASLAFGGPGGGAVQNVLPLFIYSLVSDGIDHQEFMYQIVEDYGIVQDLRDMMLFSRGPTKNPTSRNKQKAKNPEVRPSGIPGPMSKQPTSDIDVPPSSRKNKFAGVVERAGTPPIYMATQTKPASPSHASSQSTLLAIDRTNTQHSAGRTVSRPTTPAITQLAPTLSPGSSRLRRRPSVIGQTGTRNIVSQESHHQDSVYTTYDNINDPFDGTVQGITLPPVQKTSTTHANLDKTRNHRIARKPLAADTQKAVEAVQLRPLSDTPSTRYTTSPFSQLSAPTSMSSYSPNTGNENRSSSISTGRKGPSLPSSPKAFLRNSQNMTSTEQAVVPDVTQEHRASTVPPELAHLDVEYEPAPESLKSPRRPSRDNTPDLSALQRPFPIIHSDLPAYYATYRKRAPSYEAQVSVSPPPPTPPRSFFGFRSRSRSREPTTRADSVVASSPIPHDSLRSPVSASSRESTPTSGVAGSPPTSMFAKLLKNDDSSTSRLSKPAKKLRRGPAAGTGHERYGRFGLRGRTSSISDSAEPKRSDSADSVKSKVSRFWRSRSASKDSGDESDIDNLREARLSPTNTQPKRSDIGKSSHNSVPTALNDSSITLVQSQRHAIQRRESLADLDGFYRAGLLSSDVVPPKAKSRLRTLHKSQTTGDLAVGKLVDPIVKPDHTARSTKLPPMQPATTDRSSKSSRQPGESVFTDLSEGKEGNWLRSRGPRSESERMQNFHQRAKETEGSSQGPVTHGPGRVQETMRKPGPPSIRDEDINVRPQNDQQNRFTLTAPLSQIPRSSAGLHAKASGFEGRHSSMLPFPKHIDEKYPSKQPLLDRNPQKGADSADLPQVLSAQAARARTTAHLVDITRPARSPTPLVTAKPRTAAASQSLPTQILDRIQHSRSTPKVVVQPDTNGDSRLDTSLTRLRENSEFLAFPDRRDSELFYTSSSDAASIRTDSTLIAQPPRRFWLGDEDTWNEYNDLLNEVMVDKPHPTTKAKISTLPTGTQLVVPVQYSKPQSTGELRHKPSLIQIPAVIQELPNSQDVEPPASAENWNRFSRFLQPGAEPTTPYSISDIMAGYSDPPVSGRSSKARQSLPPINRESLGSGYSSKYSRHTVVDHIAGFQPEEGIIASSSLEANVDPTDRTNKHAKQHQSLLENADGNLRLGALMTSKWLSFGRVLFSPAHDEIRNSQDCRVLVIDGLGKDWSYFCAEIYENATFYNLEITTSDSPASIRAPNLPKHRNVRHSSLAAPFPFPGGFFNAVIFRFPRVASDRVYHSAIFECKRVLRAGGYLEVSVLDMDMMNMGPRVRRALRRLKTDTNAADPDTSLSNLDDTMMKLVGRRGFENIQRCVVGLPAAGRIPRSTDYSTSSDERSSLHAAINAHEQSSNAERTIRQSHDHIDFGKLLHDDTPTNPTMGSREKDEGITKMVARVGRWWYSSCYESLITESTPYATQTSIWDQPGILRECEKQGTSFRLLLCYAQKPTCPKRRTMSV
ncbi:hypothetical protein MBLNU457_1905t1 [Dothideomycetes sp. NU457]